MPTAWRSDASKAQPAGGAAIAVPMPAGTVTGDLLVAILRADNAGAFGSPPSGWTSLYEATVGGSRHGVWYKVAASESGADYSWAPPSSVGAYGIITCISGVSTGTPVSAVTEATRTAPGTVPEAPSVTPTSSGLALAMISLPNSAGISATAANNSYTLRNGGGGTKGLATATKSITAGVATGVVTFTLDASEANDTPGFTLVAFDVARSLQMIV